MSVKPAVLMIVPTVPDTISELMTVLAVSVIVPGADRFTLLEEPHVLGFVLVV